MPVTHAFVNPQADGPDPTVVRPSDWNAGHLINVVNADVDPAAAIDESKLNLNFPTHAAVTIGAPANGLSVLGQVVSLGLSSALTTGALSSADWSTFNSKQAALTFPLSPALGGTGINNGAFTLTVPASGTAALLAVNNVFTVGQVIDGSVDEIQLRIQANAAQTSNILTLEDSAGTDLLQVTGDGRLYLASAAPVLPSYFYISKLGTLAAGINYLSEFSGTHTANAAGSSLRALQFLAKGIGTNNFTDLSAFNGNVENNLTSGTATSQNGMSITNLISGGGSTTSAYGYRSLLQNTSTGGVTEYLAFEARTPTKSSTGLIAFGNGFVARNQGYAGMTRSVAVEIESQTGATTAYAIRTLLGLNKFGDQLEIIGAVDRNQLKVTGFTTQTLPAVHFIDSTGTTNAVREVQRLEARVSTAATGGAAGLGPGLGMYAETATDGTNQPQGLIVTYWVDATNATRKATLALSAYDTAERKGIEIRANGTSPDDVLLGDTWWEGEGFGLPYASFYGNDIAWSQAAAVQNTWYEISDADIADGQLNLITHDGSGKLTIAKAGRYRIDYHLVAECSVASKQIQSGLSVSGTEQNDGIDHETSAGINQQMHMGSTAILDLAAGATVEISMRTTDAGAPDISVEHINLSMVMVGGT